jgi:protein gp37
MFTYMVRYGKDPTDVHRSADATFYAPLEWQQEVLSGKRVGRDRLVFTCSLSDFWINEADPWRDEEWVVIRSCPDLIFQILTKRPQRIATHLPDDWAEIRDHVWLGISAENQAWYDQRRPFIDHSITDQWWWSLEPLLGPMDLRLQDDTRKPFWVVVGGESGPKRRTCEIAWIRSIVEQCQEAGIPVFVKQDSGFLSERQGRIPADLWACKQLPPLTPRSPIVWRDPSFQVGDPVPVNPCSRLFSGRE